MWGRGWGQAQPHPADVDKFRKGQCSCNWEMFLLPSCLRVLAVERRVVFANTAVPSPYCQITSQGCVSSVCAHLAAAPSQISLREQCQPQDTPPTGAHLAGEALASVHSIIPRTLPIPAALGCLPIVNAALEHRLGVLGQQTRDWDRSGHHLWARRDKRKGKDMKET